MTIKVLGSGCKSCKQLYENVQEAKASLGLEADVLYITDLLEIAKAGLMRTPGLIIDGKIASYGKVLSIDEIKTLLTNK